MKSFFYFTLAFCRLMNFPLHPIKLTKIQNIFRIIYLIIVFFVLVQLISTPNNHRFSAQTCVYVESIVISLIRNTRDKKFICTKSVQLALVLWYGHSCLVADRLTYFFHARILYYTHPPPYTLCGVLV